MNRIVAEEPPPPLNVSSSMKRIVDCDGGSSANSYAASEVYDDLKVCLTLTGEFIIKQISSSNPGYSRLHAFLWPFFFVYALPHWPSLHRI